MDHSRTIQKDLAASLKLSQATISLALANHPRISEATRSKVLAAAEKLGYKPDPYLSSLAEYRKKFRTVGFRATIAWVHNFLGPMGWQDNGPQTQLFESARAQAEKCGYKLENFWLREPGMSTNRINQILKNRGINGLLIMPQLKSYSHLRLDWKEFSVLRLGDYTLTKPEFHSVTADHYRSITIALRNMKKMGYRRIGYVSLQRIESRLDENLVASYLKYQRHIPAPNRIPPLIPPVLTKPLLESWIKKTKPDAILFTFDKVIYDAMKWIKQMGLSVPQDLGIALTMVAPGDPSFAGVDEHLDKVAGRAVDFLIHMMEHGERGIPENPVRLMIKGTWHEGKTLRRVSSGKS